MAGDVGFHQDVKFRYIRENKCGNEMFRERSEPGIFLCIVFLHGSMKAKPCVKGSGNHGIDLVYRRDDASIDFVRVFWADADLDEAVENFQSLGAIVWPVLYRFSRAGEKRRPLRMSGALVDD